MTNFCRTAGMAVAFSCLCAGSVLGESYRDNDRHFLLELPGDWVEMSPATLDKINQLIRQRLMGKAIKYETGFQIRNAQPGSYPYILVQWKAGPPPGSYEEIADSLRRAESKVKGEVRDIQGSISDLARNLST